MVSLACPCCPNMKTKSLLCALAGLSGFLFASCATDSGLTRVQVSATGGRERVLANQIVQAVNEYRQSVGAANLTRHSGLDRLAQQHSEFLKNNRGKFSLYGKNVSHYGFEGRASAARFQLNLSSLGENVIAGERMSGNVAKTLVTSWRGSASHDENMRQNWSLTGMGVAIDEQGNVYATQLFGTPSNSQSVWAGPVRQF